MRVLLAEASPIASRHVVERLHAAEIDVHVERRADHALSAIRAHADNFDVLLTGLLFPDICGFAFLRRLRASGVCLPVAVASMADTARARVESLRAGADAFMKLPIEGAEMVATVHALLRRAAGFATSTLRIGCVALDMDTRTVFVRERVVVLSRSQRVVLERLLLARGRIVRRDTLISALYEGREEPRARTVDVFIWGLRRALEEAGAPASFVRTAPHGEGGWFCPVAREGVRDVSMEEEAMTQSRDASFARGGGERQ